MPEFPHASPLPPEPGELGRVVRRARRRRVLQATGALSVAAGLVAGAVLSTGPGSPADDVLEVAATIPTATTPATPTPATSARPVITPAPVPTTPSPTATVAPTPTEPAATTPPPYVDTCQPFLGRAVTPDGRPLAGLAVTDVSAGAFTPSTTAADGSFGPLRGYRAQLGGGQGAGAPNVVPRQLGGVIDGPVPAAQVDTLCATVDAQGRVVRKDVVLQPGAVLEGTVTAPSCLGIDVPEAPFYQYYEGPGRIHVLVITMRRVDAHTLTYRVQGLPKGRHQGSFEVLSYPVTASYPKTTLDHRVARLPASVDGVYSLDVDLALADLRDERGDRAAPPATCLSRETPTATPTP